MAYRQSARFKAQRLTVNLRTSFSWPRTKQSDLESCEFCHRYALLTAQGASDPYLYVGCSRAEIPHFQRLLDMWPAVRMGPLLALGLQGFCFLVEGTTSGTCSPCSAIL